LDLPTPVAIVGVAESDQIGRQPEKTALQLLAEASRNALDDAGLEPEEVDGLFTAAAGSAATVAEYLRLRPRYIDGTNVGGSSYVIHVQHAMAAIQAKLCNVALICHGRQNFTTRSRTGSSWAFNRPDPYENAAASFERPFGLIEPVNSYAMACARHMALYGTTHNDLAEIAVATRKWARLNPKAVMREPMSFEDYHNSRWISYPFHLFDCCLLTDSGGAAIVTTLERARSLRKRPIRVLGSGESATHHTIGNMPDFTQTPARYSGREAFGRAGISPAEIDVAELYDSFTYTVLVTLEELGFCGKGEAGAFLRGQRTAPGGDFPMNTSGGGLSYNHPGYQGVFLVIEATRQLRDECGERQVPDARLACVNGTGGPFAATGTLVLGRD
jgi:acetyl-CoA acetyltransferase